MPEGHNHEEWLAKKLTRNKNRKGSDAPASESGGPITSDNTSVKLALTEQMKSCLMTKAGFSAEEA